ncbi:MAG: hypothetical protein ABIK86_01970 [candidate division WOR-3 bacterium]
MKVARKQRFEVQRLLTALMIFAFLGLANCVTRYVVVSAVPRSDLRIVVFANDRDQGLELLDWLEDRGYDNPHNEVAVLEEDDAAICWGAAPLSYVEEIAAYVEGRFGVELDRERAFPYDDYSVFIYLGSASVRTTRPPDREDLRIVVFTDDREKGEQFLDRLRALGYTNDESYVTDEPNDDFNIKWGAAPDEVVEEVAALADSMFGVQLERQHVFARDDNDLFVNLPFRSARPGLTRSDFAITVFCAEAQVGRRLLARLAELGYTNDANDVQPDPNDELNIKYGALPEELVAEISALIKEEFGAEPELRPELGRSSTEVFINLPARR